MMVILLYDMVCILILKMNYDLNEDCVVFHQKGALVWFMLGALLTVTLNVACCLLLK